MKTSMPCLVVVGSFYLIIYFKILCGFLSLSMSVSVCLSLSLCRVSVSVCVAECPC